MSRTEIIPILRAQKQVSFLSAFYEIDSNLEQWEKWEESRIIDLIDCAQFPRRARSLISIRDNITNDIIAMIERAGSVGVRYWRADR